VKLAAVGVGLLTDLSTAHAACVVVLVAVRQDQEELLPNRVCLLAAGAEQARRLKFSEAVYHVLILDPEDDAALVEPDPRGGHRYGAPRHGIVFRQWAHRNDALDSMGMPGAA
jgi:hypothetical protein